MCKNGRIWRWVDHTVGHSTLKVPSIKFNNNYYYIYYNNYDSELFRRNLGKKMASIIFYKNDKSFFDLQYL